MTNKLVIVESPSKSKTIGKYLGKGFTVTSSKGHIRDLSTTGKGRLGVDNRGKRKSQQVIEDINILKKSYALLMEIRSQQHK